MKTQQNGILVVAPVAELARDLLWFAVAMSESEDSHLDILHVCPPEFIPKTEVDAALGWLGARIWDVVRGFERDVDSDVHVVTGDIYEETRRHALALSSTIVIARPCDVALSLRNRDRERAVQRMVQTSPVPVLFVPDARDELNRANRALYERVSAVDTYARM